MKHVFQLSLFLFFSVTAFSQPGSFDNSFGTNGKVITPFDRNAVLLSMALQSDGKIVAAGSSGNNFAVTRYTSKGVLDNSFGTAGKVATNFGGIDEARSVAVQSDGKIVVAGIANESGYYPDIKSSVGLVRYNTDGTVDRSFGNNGKVITTINEMEKAFALAIQSDGKIVVAGSTGIDVDMHDILVLRYNTDGTLDNTFGNAGKVITDLDGADDEAYALALQPDGKIIVTGITYDGFSSTTNTPIIRYTKKGALDKTFSGDGIEIDYTGVGYALAIQQDGKILVGGRGYNDSYDPYALMERYNADGTRDDSYYYGLGYYSRKMSIIYSIALQADGKSIFAGTLRKEFSSSPTTAGVGRLDVKGKQDESFGDDGVASVKTDKISFGYDPTSVPVLIQPDGKIVTGTTYDNSFAVARLLNDNANIAAAQNNILNVQVYPNPVASNLIIKGLNDKLPASLTVTDVSGNIMIARKESNNQNMVNVAALKAGRYVAVIYQDGRMASVKFIKQ